MNKYDEIINKANDIKYSKSLKYLSHLLKGNKREQFILEIAKKNVYLASQCIMTSENNEYVENILAETAYKWSQEKDIQKKINGFLALIELNKYDIISKILFNLESIEKDLRNAVRHIINELDRDNIVSFLKVIVEAQVKGLVSTVIATVNNKNIEFSSEQKKQLEDLFPILINFYGNQNKRIFKYIITFKLSPKLLPKNSDQIIEKFIRKGEYDFIIDYYKFLKKDLPYSYRKLCELYLLRNKHTNLVSFIRAFNEINDISIKYELLKKSLEKGKYFELFVYSLIKDKKKLNILLFKNPNSNFIKTRLNRYQSYKFSDHNLIQKYALSLITDKYGYISDIIGEIVSCKIIGFIPKTIFVEIFPYQIKGSIWIKEFSKKYISDLNKVIKIGDIIQAKIIGFHEKYIQLSVLKINEI